MAFLGNPNTVDVPSADSADNNYLQDVAGNKTDTVGGTSLVALNKINKAAIDTIDAFHDVPAVDEIDNVVMRDVLGNKTDTIAGTSAISLLHKVDDHIHSESNVYPTMANGVTVTATVNAWTDLGTIVQIVPASTIVSPFDIHHISVEGVSANDVYELVLYKGASLSEIEIGRTRFSKNANQEGTESQPFQTPIIAANERISAAIASGVAAANTATFAIVYHIYD